MDLVLFAAQAFSLLLPIFLSGLFFIGCIKLGWFEFLNRPIDRGRQFRGEPLLGKNKNWRAPVMYIVLGTFVTWALHFLTSTQEWVAPVFKTNPLSLGVSITVAYSSAELINSFIKRRISIVPGGDGGKISKFFDNVDGALVSGLVYLAFGASIQLLALSFVFSYSVHASTDMLMRSLQLKKSK